MFLVSDLEHGSQVTAKIIGSKLGIAKDATVVLLDRASRPGSSMAGGIGDIIYDKRLETLLNVADDIAKNGRSGKSVVNMSFGVRRPALPPAYYDMMRKFYLLLNVETRHSERAVLSLISVCCPQSLSFKSSTSSTLLSLRHRVIMVGIMTAYELTLPNFSGMGFSQT
jgi:hypothetical protein